LYFICGGSDQKGYAALLFHSIFFISFFLQIKFRMERKNEFIDSVSTVVTDQDDQNNDVIVE